MIKTLRIEMHAITHLIPQKSACLSISENQREKIKDENVAPHDTTQSEV